MGATQGINDSKNNAIMVIKVWYLGKEGPSYSNFSLSLLLVKQSEIFKIYFYSVVILKKLVLRYFPGACVQPP